MAKKSGPRKQPSVIKCIEFVAAIHGYTAKARSKDSKTNPEEKKFLPDVVAVPFKGKGRRVFEVEATISNNTIYKSLISLLTSLKGGAENAYLVVPDKSLDFVEGCLSNLKSLIRHYSRPGKGAPKKVKLEILPFSDVGESYSKARKYDDNGRRGQPPKCGFLPRHTR